VESRRVELRDEDPSVSEDDKRDDVREAVLGHAREDSHAGTETEGEHETEGQAGDRDTSAVIEDRIENVKQKAREMAEGDKA
jgi:hypothetical protein